MKWVQGGNQNKKRIGEKRKKKRAGIFPKNYCDFEVGRRGFHRRETGEN